MKILVITNLSREDVHEDANDWNVEPSGALTVQKVLNPSFKGVWSYQPNSIQQIITYAPGTWQKVRRES